MKNSFKNVIIDSDIKSEIVHLGDVIQHIFISPEQNLIRANNMDMLVSSSVEHFVGREQEIKEIFENFEANIRIQVLYGMQGMGKRRIAYEYIRNADVLGHYKDFVWVIDFKAKHVTPEQQLFDLYDSLNIGSKSISNQHKKNKLFEWLRLPLRKGIFIFINVSEPSLLKIFLPDSDAHVLVVSEYAQWEGAFPTMSIMKIESLTYENSIHLLKLKSGGRMNEETMVNIACNLDGYPFLLEQFGNIYAANAISTNDINELMILVAKKEGLELETRMNMLITALWDLTGATHRSNRLKKGVGETLYFFGIMAEMPIPKDFILKYNEHLIESLDLNSTGFLGKLLKPIYNLRQKTQNEKVAFLSQLIQKSWVYIDSEDQIRMHSLVRRFFTEDIKMKLNGMIEKLVVSQQIVEYIKKQINLNTENPNELEKTQKIIPHAIAVAQYYENHFGAVSGLDDLYRKIGRYFESVENVSMVLHYFKKTLHIQDKQHKKLSLYLIREVFAMSVILGNIAEYEKLKLKYPPQNYLENHQLLLCEAFKCYWRSEFKQAKQYFQQAVETAPPDTDASSLEMINLLSRMVDPDMYSEESNNELDEIERETLEKHGAESEDYIMFLILKSETRIMQANYDDDTEDLISEAITLIEKAREILISIGKQYSSIYWMTYIIQVEYERRKGDPKKVKKILEYIDANQNSIDKYFNKNQYIFIGYHLAKAYIFHLEDESDSCIKAINNGIDLVKINHPDYPDHPAKIMFENLLEDINSTNKQN